MDTQTFAALSATRSTPHGNREEDAGHLPLLESTIERAAQSLIGAQRPDGHWVYELETDASSTAEYIMLTHYLGESPKLKQHQKFARYFHRTQLADGGWPLYTGGPINVSSSVKAYYALKIMGEA